MKQLPDLKLDKLVSVDPFRVFFVQDSTVDQRGHPVLHSVERLKS